MSPVSLFRHWPRRVTWGAMLLATTLASGLALVPPVVSPPWRAIVMHAFSPVCHQIPIRSPFLAGVQIAVCDRCLGIYLGLVVGVATVGGLRSLWRRLGGQGRYVFLGSLLPLGLDWLGPALGLWGNVPLSRTVTGLIFGIVAGSFVTHKLLAKAVRSTEAA